MVTAVQRAFKKYAKKEDRWPPSGHSHTRGGSAVDATKINEGRGNTFARVQLPFISWNQPKIANSHMGEWFGITCQFWSHKFPSACSYERWDETFVGTVQWSRRMQACTDIFNTCSIIFLLNGPSTFFVSYRAYTEILPDQGQGRLYERWI
jgi:hypothetical protein